MLAKIYSWAYTDEGYGFSSGDMWAWDMWMKMWNCKWYIGPVA